MTNAFNLSQLANNTNSSGQVAAGTGISGTLGVANGGTGATTLTSANVILGAGTSAVTFVAPGTTGNILKSNGTTWTSGGMPAGSVLQVVNFQTGAVATTTTIIPADDTIPQITEGAQFLSLAITPISATSKLLIQTVMQLSVNSGSSCCTALFQGATANAIAASAAYSAVASAIAIQSINYFMTSGTTSVTTFTVRFGPAGATTVTVNGIAGGRIFGGVGYSSITITEIAA